MRISRVGISNYRSIRHETIECGSHVVLLGPNNHGKSNFLSAIEFALTTSVKPKPSDFFRCGENTPCDLWVEVTFTELTDQERNTFKRYLRRDGTFTVRKDATRTDSGVDIAYHGYVQEADEWWLRQSSQDELSIRENLTKVARDVPELQPLLDKKGRVTKKAVQEVQDKYIDTHAEILTFNEVLEKGNFLGQVNVAAGLFPDFYVIPAVRDLSEETKIRTGSSLGRLVQRAIQEMASQDPNFGLAQEQLKVAVAALCPSRDHPDRAKTQIGQLESEVAQQLADWGVEVFIEVEPPTVSRLFELGTELLLDDGIETSATEKGHGLQRATLFALIRVWSRLLRAGASSGTITGRKASESLVFAVEEPELYLHPHAQRQFQAALYQLSESPGHQVFVATHSTHFVDLDHYRDICVVKRDDPENGSKVRQCSRELFVGDDRKSEKDRFHMALWVNPDRAEMLFARRVVLVEGETEKVAIPFIAERLGCFDRSVSVIDCGGKHNLPLYIELSKAFELDYIVIHDEDPIPENCPPEKLESKKRTYSFNSVIAAACDNDPSRLIMFVGDFEEACGIPRRGGEKKGKGLAALDYFQTLETQEIPKQAVDCVRAAFA